MTRQKVAKSLIDTFIDQNAHLRTCEQKLFRFFKRRNGQVTRDGGEPFQKVLECFPALQIVKQGLYGHSRPAKHRSPA